MAYGILYTTIESLIAFVALIGNFFVLILFFYDNRLKLNRNYFLISLVIVDILNALLAMPLSILVNFKFLNFLINKFKSFRLFTEFQTTQILYVTLNCQWFALSEVWSIIRWLQLRLIDLKRFFNHKNIEIINQKHSQFVWFRHVGAFHS